MRRRPASLLSFWRTVRRQEYSKKVANKLVAVAILHFPHLSPLALHLHYLQQQKQQQPPAV